MLFVSQKCWNEPSGVVKPAAVNATDVACLKTSSR